MDEELPAPWLPIDDKNAFVSYASLVIFLEILLVNLDAIPRVESSTSRAFVEDGAVHDGRERANVIPIQLRRERHWDIPTGGFVDGRPPRPHAPRGHRHGRPSLRCRGGRGQEGLAAIVVSLQSNRISQNHSLTLSKSLRYSYLSSRHSSMNSFVYSYDVS